MTKRQAAVVLAIGLAYSLAVMYRLGHINGFPQFTHWEWRWRNLGNFHTIRALFVPLALIVWVLWRIETGVLRPRPWLLPGLLALSNYALQILGMMADPRGVQLVQQLVMSEGTTGYYTDALHIQNVVGQNVVTWMGHFHELSRSGHGSTHPAGPILFYYLFINLFGPMTGALVAGCCIGLAGSVGVLVMYKFASLWTADQRTRLLASAFYALLPALVVFLPEFDQAYPIFSMLLILCWVKALDGSSRPLWLAAGAGAILFIATFFAYNMLAVGAFFAYYGLYSLWRNDWSRATWALLVRTAGIAVTVCTGLYALLWAATGYNFPAAFAQSLRLQAYIAGMLQRPYSTFVVFDLLDFSLGAGVIALVLLFFYVTRGAADFAVRKDVALTLIGLTAILTINFSGLLRGETGRVWLFLQPLVIVPAALELAQLRWSWRLSIFAMQWWILVCLKAKMDFLEP